MKVSWEERQPVCTLTAIEVKAIADSFEYAIQLMNCLDPKNERNWQYSFEHGKKSFKAIQETIAAMNKI